MANRVIQHLRSNVIAYLALVVAISGGAGYALAATHSTKIHGCVSRRTHALYVKRRCGHGQRALTWNRLGRRGKTGATGAAASSAFGVIDTDGAIFGSQSKGISVKHTTTGVYAITITAKGCSKGGNAPTVTPTDTVSGPLPTGAVPVAWIDANASGDAGDVHFTVYTGYESTAGFTSADVRFDLEDACNPPGSTR